jgi:uncharacterized membrane protein YjgN (DUF898 family)
METPPNYSQYPRAGQTGGVGGSGRGYRGPGVYFDFISESWEMIKKNMGVYVVAVLLAGIINQIISFPFSMISNNLLYGNPLGVQNPRPGELPPINWSMLPIAVVLVLIPGAIANVITIGISLCALEEADTGATNLNTMFSGFRNFLPLALTTFLYILVVYVGLFLCLVPGIYVAGVFGFAPIISAKEGLGPIEAMKKSYWMLKGHAWAFCGIMLVAVLASGLGIIACCVGILFTAPIVHICLALHYREFRGPLNQGYVAPFSS